MLNKHTLQQPTICIISGVAASGKTLLGTEMAKKLVNSAFLSKDLIQDAFTRTERSGELYEEISLPTFRILLDFADIQLSQGKVPVIDCPFSFNHQRKDERRDWVECFRKVAEKYGARLVIIRCLPPNEEELKKRLKERGYKWDKWKLENWEAFLKRDPINFPILHDDVYEIATEKTPEELAEKVLVNYLKAKPCEYS